MRRARPSARKLLKKCRLKKGWRIRTWFTPIKNDRLNSFWTTFIPLQEQLASIICFIIYLSILMIRIGFLILVLWLASAAPADDKMKAVPVIDSTRRATQILSIRAYTEGTLIWRVHNEQPTMSLLNLKTELRTKILWLYSSMEDQDVPHLSVPLHPSRVPSINWAILFGGRSQL